MEKYGTEKKHFTKIAAKNKRHSVNNPYSQFRIEMTEEQVDADKQVFEMLTRQHCKFLKYMHNHCQPIESRPEKYFEDAGTRTRDLSTKHASECAYHHLIVISRVT